MRDVKLTNHTVTIKEKDDLSFGDIEDLQAVLITGVKMRNNSEIEGFTDEVYKNQNHKVAEVAIEKIVDGEGKEIPFTVDWLRGLKPAQDGLTLMAELQKETQDIGKKKAPQS